MRRNEGEQQSCDLLRRVEAEYTAEADTVEDENEQRPESRGDAEGKDGEGYLHVIGDDLARHHRPKDLGVGDVTLSLPRSTNSLFGPIEHARRDEGACHRRLPHDGRIRDESRSEEQHGGDEDWAPRPTYLARCVDQQEAQRVDDSERARAVEQVVRARHQAAQIEELRTLAATGGGAQPRQVRSEIAILGNELANAVFAERTETDTLRLGELCRERVPSRRSRRDDDIPLACRALLVAGDHAARPGVSLGVVQPDEAREVAGALHRRRA